LATITKLNSGSWRAQVRRKGKYVNETFRRRKDAEEWALEVERRIDRGESALSRSSRDTETFSDLIKLHREDLQEVGNPLDDLSPRASLSLRTDLGDCASRNSIADGSSFLEKNARAKARVRLLLVSIWDTSGPFCRTRLQFTA